MVNMIKREDILNIAGLSKLFVEENELDNLAKEMENIVKFADEINNAEISSDEFDNINGLCNVLREDIAKESFDRELILKNADGGKNGFFQIKNYNQ